MFRDARHGSWPSPPPPPRIAIPQAQESVSMATLSSSAPSNRARSEAGGSASDGDKEMTLLDAEEREDRFPKTRRVDKACNFCRSACCRPIGAQS
jgi:hypothetical protein